MDAELFSQWLGYLQVKEGSYEYIKTPEELAVEQFDECEALLNGCDKVHNKYKQRMKNDKR